MIALDNVWFAGGAHHYFFRVVGFECFEIKCQNANVVRKNLSEQRVLLAETPRPGQLQFEVIGIDGTASQEQSLPLPTSAQPTLFMDVQISWHAFAPSSSVLILKSSKAVSADSQIETGHLPGVTLFLSKDEVIGVRFRFNPDEGQENYRKFVDG